MDFLEYRKKNRDKGMTRMGRLTFPVFLLLFAGWTLAILGAVAEVYIYQTHPENDFSYLFRGLYLLCAGVFAIGLRIMPKIAIPKTPYKIAEIRNNAIWQWVGLSLMPLVVACPFCVLWFLKAEPMAIPIIAGCYIGYWVLIIFTQVLTRNYLRLLKKHGLWEPDDATSLWLGDRKGA